MLENLDTDFDNNDNLSSFDINKLDRIYDKCLEMDIKINKIYSDIKKIKSMVIVIFIFTLIFVLSITFNAISK